MFARPLLRFDRTEQRILSLSPTCTCSRSLSFSHKHSRIWPRSAVLADRLWAGESGATTMSSRLERWMARMWRTREVLFEPMETWRGGSVIDERSTPPMPSISTEARCPLLTSQGIQRDVREYDTLLARATASGSFETGARGGDRSEL